MRRIYVTRIQQKPLYFVSRDCVICIRQAIIINEEFHAVNSGLLSGRAHCNFYHRWWKPKMPIPPPILLDNACKKILIYLNRAVNLLIEQSLLHFFYKTVCSKDSENRVKYSQSF